MAGMAAWLAEQGVEPVDPNVARVAFGRRLRAVRKEQGMSQDDLGRATGVHPTAIGRFEHGRREPRLTSILCLARGLGVQPGALLNELIPLAEGDE